MQIDTAFETYDKFFNLSLDVKQKYTKKTGTTKNGWDEFERERCVFVFHVLHMPSINHNYVASNVIDFILRLKQIKIEIKLQISNPFN